MKERMIFPQLQSYRSCETLVARFIKTVHETKKQSTCAFTLSTELATELMSQSSNSGAVVNKLCMLKATLAQHSDRLLVLSVL